jgi:hypothetical protein
VKPRLDSEPLTFEDMAINVGGQRSRPDGRFHLWSYEASWRYQLSMQQDSRDAELMHAWTHVLQVDGSFRTCPTCWQVAHSPGAGIVSVTQGGERP